MKQMVSFPGLGLSFELNRVAFSVFGIPIYWYALIICTGLVIAFFYAVREGKRQNLSSDVFLDIILYCLPAGIVGARLYYVLSKWDYYGEHPLQILNIRGGGLAIYGGIIAAVLTALIYCYVKKQKTMQIFDICSVGLLIGQGIGRWGNFVNVEAHGYETALPWRMEVYSEYYQRIAAVHPTFLYESLWNLSGAVLLAFLIRRKKADGQIFWLYLIWYGVGRFFIEGLRTDSLMFFSFRISQLVALACVALGIVMSVLLLRKKMKK